MGRQWGGDHLTDRKRRGADQLPQSVTSIYICLLITVFLLYPGTKGYQSIASEKFLAFLVLCGGYIALMAILMLEMVLIGEIKPPKFKGLFARSSWIQRFSVLYLAITWLSAIVSPYWPGTIIGISRYEGALTMTVYVLSFLLISIFGRIASWMLPVFGVAVMLFDSICILQLLGKNPLHLYPEGYNYFGANIDYGGAYLGTIGNVDMVAAFLCVSVAILWIALVRCFAWQKYLLLLPLLASLFVLIKMWVLSGLVAVIGGAVLSLAVVLPVSPKGKNILWGAIAGCAAVGLAAVLLVDAGSGLFHELHELLRGNMSDEFGSGRIYIWKQIFDQVPSQFFLGSGPDTMELAGIDPFVRFDERIDTVIMAKIDVAHSEYLNILYHQGVFALLAYVAMLVIGMKKWARYANQREEIAILGGAILSYCIQALFGISYCGTTVYFWTILGLLDAVSNQMSFKGVKVC